MSSYPQTQIQRHVLHVAPDLPHLLTHWLTLRVFNLQKSNQYVNSVISVKSITAPFTQKPKPGTFQSCFLYLWYEIQILSNEGEKHRRAKGWGLSSCCILPMSIWRICHPSSPFLSLFYHKHTHNQLWKYFSIPKCPGAGKATRFSPAGGRSEKKSTLCFTVRLPEIHRLPFTCKGSPTAQKQAHSPTEWRAAIQQKLSPSADGAPDSEQQPKTWMSPVSFSPFQTPKIQGQERKGDSGVTVQWQGCWKDGEVTRRTFTTLRGWWGHRGGTMEAQGCLFILGVIFLSHLPPLTQWQRAYWKLQEAHVLLYPGPELSFCCQFRREYDLM